MRRRFIVFGVLVLSLGSCGLPGCPAAWSLGGDLPACVSRQLAW